jgi:hypothetical protein
MVSAWFITKVFVICNLCIGVVGNVLTLLSLPRLESIFRKNKDPYKAQMARNDWYTSTIFVVNLAIWDLAYCCFFLTNIIINAILMAQDLSDKDLNNYAVCAIFVHGCQISYMGAGKANIGAISLNINDIYISSFVYLVEVI